MSAELPDRNDIAKIIYDLNPAYQRHDGEKIEFNEQNPDAKHHQELAREQTAAVYDAIAKHQRGKPVKREVSDEEIRFTMLRTAAGMAEAHNGPYTYADFQATMINVYQFDETHVREIEKQLVDENALLGSDMVAGISLSSGSKAERDYSVGAILEAAKEIRHGYRIWEGHFVSQVSQNYNIPPQRVQELVAELRTDGRLSGMEDYLFRTPAV
jgi:hypothetical protein